MASAKPTPMCRLMLACDGSNLNKQRIPKGYCRPCEDALQRREERKLQQLQQATKEST